jgi:tetratricopeptide (TPR) repeat protein
MPAAPARTAMPIPHEAPGSERRRSSADRRVGPSGRRRALLGLAVPLALGVLAYSNSLDGQFVFDDVPSIVENPVVHDLGSFAPGGDGHVSRPTRTVGYLSFALNYRIGGLEVTGYHAVNLGIHLASAALVFALVLLTFRTPRLASSPLARSSHAVAMAAAALFVAHPIQTQAVSYIVQRLTSLAALFYLLALVLFAATRLADPARPAWRRVAGDVAVVACAALAMKSKEIAFTLPFAVALYDLSFLDGSPWARARRLAPVALTLAIIPLTLVDVGAPLSQVVAEAEAKTAVQITIPRLHYLATELPVIASYLRLLLWPVGQSVDPDVTFWDSFLAPPVLAGGMVIAALLALAAALYLYTRSSRVERKLDPAWRVVAFGIVGFFLALSVESSVIPIVDPMNEHRVYLPSAAFFVAVAAALGLVARALAPDRAGRLAGGIAVALAAVLAVGTYARNEVWTDELSLWSDAAAKATRKARPWNNMGVALHDRGRHEEGRAALQNALRIEPSHPEAYYNLARIVLTVDGRPEQAVPLLERALRLNPGYLDARVNLAAALLKLNRPADVIAVLDAAGPRLDRHPQALFNRGVAEVLLGDPAAALGRARELRPLSADLANSLERYARGAMSGRP